MGVSRPIRLSERLGLSRREARPSRKSSPLEDLVIITGFSGAGKSTAMAVFEDVGYFCVDNLPPEMIGNLAELFSHSGAKVERAAVVSDVRGGEYFEGLQEILSGFDANGTPYRLLFLEADEATLVTRYKETRRRHPLADAETGGGVRSAIAEERELLAPLRARADVVLDTQGLNTGELRRRIAQEFLPRQHEGPLAVNVQTFGFKYGPARDADLLFDCRFLPNPHYDPDLRPLTGLDPEVVAYANRDGELDEFCAHLHHLLDYLLPRYVEEGKSHLVIAVGCTGGRHRSVAVARCLAERYGDRPELSLEVTHRDIHRPAR